VSRRTNPLSEQSSAGTVASGKPAYGIEAVAKGKPKPPACNCPESIGLPNGDVCVLVDCGFDCVYACPLP